MPRRSKSRSKSRSPSRSISRSKPVVVIFLASWCGICKSFKRDGGLKELKKHFKTNVKIDSNQSDVNGFPTFRKGKGRDIVGYDSEKGPKHVVKQLKSL